MNLKTKISDSIKSNISNIKPSNTHDVQVSISSSKAFEYYFHSLRNNIDLAGKDDQIKQKFGSITQAQYLNNIDQDMNDYIQLTSKLAEWIYAPDDETSNCELFNEPIQSPITLIKTDKQTGQSCQWSIIQFKNHSSKLFLTFRGTDSTQLLDLIADIGFTPMPIYPDPKNNKSELFCHASIYAYLIANYYHIWKEILNRYKTNKFDEIIVTGHSLGGALSIVFALISLIDNKFDFINDKVKIITYGAPIVLSYFKHRNQLSSKSQNILEKLENRVHNIIHQFDCIPRLLISQKWIRFVVDAGASKLDKFVIAPNKAAKGAFSKLKRTITNKELVIESDILNEKVRTEILVGTKDYQQKSVMKHLFSIDSILESTNLFDHFQLCGKYYISFDGKMPILIDNMDKQSIKLLLTYLPYNLHPISKHKQLVLNNHSMTNYVQCLIDEKSQTSNDISAHNEKEQNGK